MKSDEEIMQILEAFDLTQSFRDAGELAGCSPNTVARRVAERDGGTLERPARRDQLIDPYLSKVEEWVDASHGKVRADVAHDKLVALGYTGSERTTRRALASAKKAYRDGRRRIYRPWVPEPGMWFQYDFGDGPVVAGVGTVLFCAWLSWSRFRVVIPILDKTLPSVIACIDATLRRFGGCPTYALTDNEKTVTTAHVARIAIRNREMVAAARHYGLTIATCVVADPESKGGSEATVRVAKADLGDVSKQRRTAAEWLCFDRMDGMLSRECTGGFQPAGWRGRDGALHFPTVNGVATIRPEEIELNKIPPSVVIEQANAYGRAPRRGGAALHAGPGRSRLEFRFTALSFAAPEKVRFRTQLEGLEDEWHDAGILRTVAYEAVPPGSYRFRVIAANSDGVWNETGAALAVTVAPHYWETPWFQIFATGFATVIAVTIGATISRARMRGRMLRLEAQTSREMERARIAQDLHDDLGASLTEISMLAHLAGEELVRERGRDALPEIASKAHRLVGALDEIVWAANPRHDNLASLAEYLTAFAAEFLDAAGIALRLDIPRELPALSLGTEQRHGLFLAVREALNNAVKHSGASEVWLRLNAESGGVTATVEDNGRGISTDTGEFSEGLRNLRSRMTGIGGACRIESGASGTRVIFTLPLPGKRGVKE